MSWAGHVACMGEKRNVWSAFIGKQEGKMTLERLRCSWEDNIKKVTLFCFLPSLMQQDAEI
jgi:hypothetical protein